MADRTDEHPWASLPPEKFEEFARAFVAARQAVSVAEEFPADDVVCDQCDEVVNLDDAELVTFEDGETGYACPACVEEARRGDAHHRAHATPSSAAHERRTITLAVTESEYEFLHRQSVATFDGTLATRLKHAWWAA